jgi:hypothetical protein
MIDEFYCVGTGDYTRLALELLPIISLIMCINEELALESPSLNILLEFCP